MLSFYFYIQYPPSIFLQVNKGKKINKLMTGVALYASLTCFCLFGRGNAHSYEYSSSTSGACHESLPLDFFFPAPPSLREREDKLDPSKAYIVLDEEDESAHLTAIHFFCRNDEACRKSAEHELDLLLPLRHHSPSSIELTSKLQENKKITLALPAADYSSSVISFDTPLVPAATEATIHYYYSTNILATAFFFCQYHLTIMLQKDGSRNRFDDIVACKDRLVLSLNETKPAGDLAEFHASLREKSYASSTVAAATANLPYATPTLNSPQCMEMSMSLGCLFFLHGTDKGWHHGYHRTYAGVLEEFRRAKNLKFLEIGVFRGSSLKVGFPNSCDFTFSI